ncbi:MAG: Nif3-like dinuclear metal center hexameric protein [Clostridia bacterium]|nr:Nif3-like dinuclear metal center hexameric protein [Clostridia bacterium]
MTLKELYDYLEEKMPPSLREDWDNDGMMCCPDTKAEVKRVLVSLDVTEEIVDYAIDRGFDLIISHHPLIFKPVSSVTDSGNVSRKIIKLIESGVSVFSFHSRADKVVGGVNDILCDLLGIFNAESFGEGELGRIGEIDEEIALEDFVYRVKQTLGSDMVRYSDGLNPVRRVALVGGDGKDFVKSAIDAGADTYLSGRISYNMMVEAAEMGINLVEAGHYFTEQPVTDFFQELLIDFDPEMYVEIAVSNCIKMY